MRAISVRQPWAWPIVHGYKNIENRDYNFVGSFRGPIFIHASQTIEPDHWPVVRRILESEGYDPDELPEPDRIEKGGFVGRAEILDVTRISSSAWFVGPFGILLGRASPIPFVRYPGKLGLFDVDEAALNIGSPKVAGQKELFG